jgi:glycosyltransferase involved in cell wall biosynthesis
LEWARRVDPDGEKLCAGVFRAAGGVAQALENVYRDPRRRQELSQAAFAMAQKTEYSWDAVAQQFGDLFVAMAK